VKTTAYFEAIRRRPDRAVIHNEWIQRAVESPIRQVVQADGRIRRWSSVPEAGDRFLRVVLLSDGETVHNAFFDRGFKP
jgi:hypothetical protein